MAELSKERKAFERWFEAQQMPAEADWFRRDDLDPEDYRYAPTQFSWEAWQARANQVMNGS